MVDWFTISKILIFLKLISKSFDEKLNNFFDLRNIETFKQICYLKKLMNKTTFIDC